MFELLVPATPGLGFDARSGGNKKDYDRELRPELMAHAERLTSCKTARIEPDVWKIEGLDRPRGLRAGRRGRARRDGRNRVGCSVLGRGEDDTKVREWLKTAAAVPGFIGFAVGRTSFWGPLTDWKDGRIARDAAVNEIALGDIENAVDIFEAAGRARAGRLRPEGGKA